MQTPALLDTILEQFGLTGDQRAAAVERRRSVTVTAGAGSGKTRTLAARYLGLLSEGRQPGEVAAITFTEKAAREMRTRVRGELRKWILSAEPDEERRRWLELEARMDSARIGTIHSLCAEILRAHPAEAGLDPRFGVLDENQSTRLRVEAVDAALVWAVEEGSRPAEGQADRPALRALFDIFSVGRLQSLLGLLLNRRLEVRSELFDPREGERVVSAWLSSFLARAEVQSILVELHQAQAGGSLKQDAGDKLSDQIGRLLALFDQAGAALARGETLSCATALWQARRTEMALNVGRRGARAKDALIDLRDLFDRLLDPWLGGKQAASQRPDAPLEERLAGVLPLLGQLYARALALYQGALSERQALDFDDLEAGALALLGLPEVAARWQAELAAVLVDEFQDTNERQRQIVLALCGPRLERLFVVGDARQSIYRFRGADVTVFTGLQAAMRSQGGLTFDLDRTFRAHPPLLESGGSLLAAVMGDQPDPERPYYVPFAPLVSLRESPRTSVKAPFVECLLGAGPDSEEGRRAAAWTLALRLREMQRVGEIVSWDDVALLFRASTGFPFYETALEAAGIPFVTVAGSGFYDRPEVRDLLNSLRALADPWDDQALAGFLRSPVVGLSDAGLYCLRYQDGGYRSLRQALEAPPAALSAEDHRAASRALDLLGEFEPWVDRLPVAELLRRLVARTDGRAILASARSRLWRNVDKLLADARSSGLVRVRAFLEYVEALRDVGAREGEAVAESLGAVRLMTIHKSKGLEFPLVVLADAARQAGRAGDLAFPLRPEAEPGPGCWTVLPDRLDYTPLAYRLARLVDGQQAEAELGRLLYVALTRAQDKLLISGHVAVKDDGSWRTGGWLESLLAAGGGDVAACLSRPGEVFETALPGGGAWRISVGASTGIPVEGERPQAPAYPESSALPLVEPLTFPSTDVQAGVGVVAEPGLENDGSRAIRIAGRAALPVVVGRLVHQALRRWLFPGDGPALDALLTVSAQQAGLPAGQEMEEALRIARILLARFRRHPLWSEVQSAAERHHALPCILAPGSQSGQELIDLLYRAGLDWTLVDFYTASLSGQAAIQAVMDLRRPVLQAKRAVVAASIGVVPSALVCFLDVDHRVQLQPGA